MGTIDEVTRRLAAIHDELSALPGGASADRYRLLKERDQLREEAAHLVERRDTERSSQELNAELAALKHRRKELVAARTGFAMSKGGSNAAPATGAWVKLSLESMAAADIGRINARISRIEDVLAERGEEAAK